MRLLDVRGLTRSFYGVHALTGLDLDVEAATITGPARRSVHPCRSPTAGHSGRTVRGQSKSFEIVRPGVSAPRPAAVRYRMKRLRSAFAASGATRSFT